jgi:hypothetical protein
LFKLNEISSQELEMTIEKSSTENKNKNNNSKKKENIMISNFIILLKSIIIFNSMLALQEAILFKDGNLTVHSFFEYSLFINVKGTFIMQFQ